MLIEIISEIEKLMKAYRLLQKLFEEYGPYRNGQITSDTWYEVCDFLGFDDSE